MTAAKTTDGFYSRLRRMPNGCLEWTEGCNDLGYGTLRMGGQKWLAHRLAWVLKNGPIPDGLLVRHKVCDNPPCCDDEHLALGTDADNKRDSVQKKRHKWPVHPGEMHVSAKLTSEKVLAIRVDARPQRRIAAHHGITQSLVSLIKLRKRWSHIP